jgi:hypothetical protein
LEAAIHCLLLYVDVFLLWLLHVERGALTDGLAKINSISVIGNTTCPASDLATLSTTITRSHLDDLDFILKQYDDRVSPFQMCPAALFAEIIRINHQRMRAATKRLSTTPESLFAFFSQEEEEEEREEAYEILRRIHAFSPEQWAASKSTSQADWMLLGGVYQATVALYCISSLQSLSVLPPACPLLRARCVAHGRSLRKLLEEALPLPRIKRFMLWPLVVLGVEAVNLDGNEGPELRTFVAQRHLPELSRHVGSYVPLTARHVLERFWASGETCWDACFDKPYAFATQIAVDVSRISPFVLG